MNKIVNRFSQIISTVLIITISYMFCSCPINPIPKEPPPQGPSPLTPGVGTPRYFFIDSDGNCIENENDDHGRTGLIVEGNKFAEGVLVYSDDTGMEDIVAFANDYSVVSMFFKKGSNFPYRMAITNGSDKYYTYVSPYNDGNNTYNITFLKNGYYETMDNVVLNKNIFLLYEDDPELSNSQNRRMANIIIAMGIWGSLYATLDQHLSSTGFAIYGRGILGGWSNFFMGAAEVFINTAFVAVVVATVVVPVISFIAPVEKLALTEHAFEVTNSVSVDIPLAYLFDVLESDTKTKPPAVQTTTVLVTLPHESNRNIEYNSSGNHEEFHIPLGSDLIVKFYIPNSDFSGMTTASLYNGLMFIDEPSVPKGDDAQNISLFVSPPATLVEASSTGEFVVKFKRKNLSGFIGDGKVNFGFVFCDENGQPIELSVNDYTGGFNFRLPEDGYELKLYKNMVVIRFCMDINCPDIQP